MKKLIFLFIVTAPFLFSCKKYSEIRNDVQDKYIHGRLFIQDSINDIGTIKPINSAQKVRLSYKQDTSQFLYDTMTDSNGYFTFNNLATNKEYRIYAERETVAGDFKAMFSTTYDITLNESKTAITPLLLFDTSKQNGVLFNIKDAATLGVMNNCEACFFTSRLIWARDSCDYKTFGVTSNNNGFILKTNLLPGKYYVLFKKTAGTLILKQKDSIVVATSGIRRKDIFLQ